MDALAISALALALRLSVVAWAPPEFGGDALFYHATAITLMRSGAYL